VYDGDFAASDAARLEELRGFDEVTGSVTLTGAIDDLSALECLTRVGRDLELSSLRVRSLRGLEALQHVEGSLIVERLDSLVDLRALSAVESVGDDLRVWANPLLATLSGLEGITHVEQVVVSSNPQLADLEGLSGLTTAGTVNINRNTSLTNVEGLRNLVSCALLALWDLQSLTTLEGLRNLRGAQVEITTAPELRTLHGLEQISGATVMIHWLPQLRDLSGLGTVEALSVGGNAMLESLDGIGGVSSSAGFIWLELNPNLVDIGALASVTECGFISVENNVSLRDLSGLSQLTRVGDLRIQENPLRENRDALSQVTAITEEDVDIVQNARLSDLHGLDGVTSVVGRLYIAANPILPTCEAERLVNHIGVANIGETSLIQGNDDSGVCP
jgi:hypothetical protein